ncbi:MAG: hypothetical protein J1E42_03835 [Akkermansiaceae bacterium]|nr:hypothetical protein [Akkermansiaceae bacterium]
MKKTVLVPAVLSVAALGMLGLSSCDSMKKLGDTLEGAGLNVFEPTDEVSAKVVHASTPVYSAGGEHIMGKGKGEIKTTAGWSQSIIVKTDDGKQYKGSINVDTRGECVSTGDRGIAKITRRSKILRNFQASR